VRAVLTSALVALVLAVLALATLGHVLVLALATLGHVLLVATSLVHVMSHFILEHEIIFTQGMRGERRHTHRCRNSLHF